MNNVYLDCTGLHNIKLDTSDMRSIQVDGSYFLEQLRRTILETQQEVANYNNIMKPIPEYTTPESVARKERWELILALASNPSIVRVTHGVSLNSVECNENAKDIIWQAETILKQLEKV